MRQVYLINNLKTSTYSHRHCFDRLMKGNRIKDSLLLYAFIINVCFVYLGETKSNQKFQCKNCKFTQNFKLMNSTMEQQIANPTYRSAAKSIKSFRSWNFHLRFQQVHTYVWARQIGESSKQKIEYVKDNGQARHAS